MSYTKTQTTEFIVAESHPSLVDTKNRAGKELHAKMLVQHDSNGSHKGLAALCYGDNGLFVGDGTSNRTINLNDPLLIPKFAMVQQLPPDDPINYNWLPNPDFETDMDTWTVTATGTGTATGGVAGGQSGNCCQISLTDNETVTISYSLLEIYIPLRPFFVSVYAKCTDAALLAAGQTYTVNLTNDDVFDTPNTKTFTFTNSWVKCSDVVGTFDENGDLVLEISVTGAGTGAFSGIYFDTVLLSPAYFLNDFAIRTDTMSDSFFRMTTSYFTPPYALIGELGTAGEITVSPNPIGGGPNQDGIDCYYLVLGTHAPGTYTGTPGGSDPNWVEDGQQMLGGNAGTEPANRVENYIDTQFLVEHTNAGAHTSSPFAGYMQIETGSFSGSTGTQVTLVNSEMRIREVFVIETSSWIVYTATDTMPAGDTKTETATSFVTNKFTYIGTGTFTFQSDPTKTYHYVALGD